MEELRKEIEELKRRVNQLEKPTQFSAEFVTALVNAGFVKVNKILEYESNTQIRWFNLFLQVQNKELVVGMLPSGYYKEFTVDVANDKFISPNHGLSDGMQIWVFSTGGTPGPIGPGSIVFVLNATENDFEVEATFGSGKINLIDRGSGVLYFQYMT